MLLWRGQLNFWGGRNSKQSDTYVAMIADILVLGLNDGLYAQWIAKWSCAREEGEWERWWDRTAVKH